MEENKFMRKKILVSLLALCTLMVFCLTGCGKSGSDGIYDYDLSNYIVPANYTGVTISPIDVSVTADDIKAEIDSRREAAAETETVTTGTVASGDAINIDYVGTIDGEEFAGGNSQNKGVDIIVGSAGYIDGFEAGLVGAQVGSTVVLDLRFPDNYGSTDLAGKDCQFTVTIHTKELKHIPDYDLDWVKSVSSCESLNDYEATVYDELLKEATEKAEHDRNNAIWQQLVEKSDALDYPAKELKEEMERYRQYISNYASQFGYTLNDYMSIMGMDEAKLNEEIENYAKEVVKNEMLLFYIAREQGMTVSDEEYSKAIDDIIKEQGFESEQEFEDQYKMTVEELYSKKYIITDIYLEKVMDYIIENGKIQ